MLCSYVTVDDVIVMHVFQGLCYLGNEGHQDV